MNSLKDGKDFLNIKKSKYNNTLNKIDLTQNNTSGYESIIENLDNMVSISSQPSKMGISVNTNETLDNLLNNKILEYKDNYKILEDLLNNFNDDKKQMDKLLLEKSILEEKTKLFDIQIDNMKASLDKYNNSNNKLETVDGSDKVTDRLLSFYLMDLTSSESHNETDIDNFFNSIGMPEEIKSLYEENKPILKNIGSKYLEAMPLYNQLQDINSEIRRLSYNLNSFTIIRFRFDRIYQINNEIKDITSNLLKNINKLKEENKIDPQYNSVFVDSIKKSQEKVSNSFEKMNNIISDINNYKPGINGNYNLLSNDINVRNITSDELNKSINDNYKYANINFLAMRDDSLKFNKYEKYQYIIWLIFILIILLMVYKSITDSGPISITTGLFYLTFLFLFYYIITLFIK